MHAPANPATTPAGPSFAKPSPAKPGARRSAFAWFGNIKIGVKVFASFGAVIALVVALAGNNLVQGGKIAGSFFSFRDTAEDAMALHSLDADLMTLAWKSGSFIDTWDSYALTDTQGLIQKVGATIDEAIAEKIEDQNAGDVQQLKDIKQSYDAYAAKFDEVQKALTRIIALDGQMEKVSKDVVPSIRALVDGALSYSNYPAMAMAAQLEARFLTLRFTARDFLHTKDKMTLDLVENTNDDLIQEMTELGKVLGDPELEPMWKDTSTRITEFKTLFDEAAQLTLANQSAINDVLLPSLTQMREVSDGLKASVLEDEMQSGENVAGGISATRTSSIVISGVIVLLSVVIAMLIVRSVAGPVRGMTNAMTALAGGNKQVAIPGASRGDEIGSMAAAVVVFKDSMIKAEELAAAQEELKARAEAERKAAMNKLADEFEAQVKGIVQTVATASTELEGSAQTMSATAEETSRQSSAARNASQQTSANVQTVSSAATELSASVAEVNRQVTHSSQMTTRAATDAENTNRTVEALAAAASKISDVVNLISDIAAQTNLLALNATIEAARAGNAGKGFAVVASEVKNLATQTGKATEEISSQIAAIQAEVDNSVTAIRNIAAAIHEINAVSNQIATAMEQQGSATIEIARNVQAAARGTEEVSGNIDNVTQAAAETGSAASQVLGAAAELGRQSDLLQSELGKFVATIRRA
jgi:methyl-accepting chemotaxis protein